MLNKKGLYPPGRIADFLLVCHFIVFFFVFLRVFVAVN